MTDMSPELMQALWEAGKAAAKHLGLGEPEYMTICGRGEEIAMQEEKTINWYKLTPEQRDETVHEKVFGHERKTVQYDVPSAREGETTFVYSVTSWQTGGPDAPHYTTSMDAAWLVLQEMVERRKINERTFALFADQLFDMASQRADDGDWSAIWGDYILAAQWTPAMICLAALCACGYEVLTEEVK